MESNIFWCGETKNLFSKFTESDNLEFLGLEKPNYLSMLKLVQGREGGRKLSRKINEIKNKPDFSGPFQVLLHKHSQL